MWDDHPQYGKFTPWHTWNPNDPCFDWKSLDTNKKCRFFRISSATSSTEKSCARPCVGGMRVPPGYQVWQLRGVTLDNVTTGNLGTIWHQMIYGEHNKPFQELATSTGLHSQLGWQLLDVWVGFGFAVQFLEELTAGTWKSPINWKVKNIWPKLSCWGVPAVQFRGCTWERSHMPSQYGTFESMVFSFS